MRTCRVETERRIVSLAGELDGWTADFDEAASSDEPLWFVTPVLDDGIPLGRVVVIGLDPGTVDGLIEPTGIAGTTDPSEDAWQIIAMAATFGETAAPPLDDADDRPLSWRAKQVVEDAMGDLRDLLAANHRLAVDGGPFIGVHDVRLSQMRGPWFSQGPDADPGAFAPFTIDCRAQLRAGSNP